MRFVLVVDRRQLFPGLSPQGYLPAGTVDLQHAARQAFFAERDFMEECSHFQQVIPYIALTLGDRVLCYQRTTKHSEQRLGGLWTIGFGGHIEPLDRDDDALATHGLLAVAARRELLEETGLELPHDQLVQHGCINDDSTAVSSVHFGVFYTAALDGLGLDEAAITARVEAQAEPHRVAWRSVAELEGPAPHGGQWEDWSRLALVGLRESRGDSAAALG